MTAIRCVIALTSGRAPCARCEAFHAVTSGVWHAVEPALPHLPICDSCVAWDDPDGTERLLSLRRTEERT